MTDRKNGQPSPYSDHAPVWFNAEWRAFVVKALCDLDDLRRDGGDPKRTENVRCVLTAAAQWRAIGKDGLRQSMEASQIVLASAQRLGALADHARALLAVAPVCRVCDRRPATKRLDYGPDGLPTVNASRCDACAPSSWPDLPQAAAIRAVEASK